MTKSRMTNAGVCDCSIGVRRHRLDASTKNPFYEEQGDHDGFDKETALRAWALGR